MDMSHFRGARRVVPSLAASLLLALGVASAASAADTPSPSPSAPQKVTFGIGPATAKALDSRLDFSLLEGRGQSLTDYVGVVNLSTTPLPVTIYAVDAVSGTDGAVTLKPRGESSNDLSSWVKLDIPGGKSEVVVPARGKLFIPFTVTVPQDAAVGDHLAGLVASITATGGQEGAPQLNLEQRVGVRLNMRVAGAMEPALAVENLTAEYAGTLNPVGRGSVVVHYTVRNAGNVRLGGRQLVALHGLFGSSQEASDLQDIPLLMPGASVDVTTVIPDVLPLVSLSTDVTVTAAAPAGDANPDVAPASASTHLWAVPYTLLVLLLLLALVLVGLRGRRGNSQPGGRHGGAPANPLASPPSGPVLIPSGPAGPEGSA